MQSSQAPILFRKRQVMEKSNMIFPAISEGCGKFASLRNGQPTWNILTLHLGFSFHFLPGLNRPRKFESQVPAKRERTIGIDTRSVWNKLLFALSEHYHYPRSGDRRRLFDKPHTRSFAPMPYRKPCNESTRKGKMSSAILLDITIFVALWPRAWLGTKGNRYKRQLQSRHENQILVYPHEY